MNAMRDGKVVEMTYKSFWHDEPHSFKAHLYCLKVFKQRWYVLAYSEVRKQNRIYGLDRILDIKVLDAPLKLPKGFNAAEFFCNYYGVFLDTGKAETVELKVDSGQVNYVDSLPLHDSQTKVEETAEYAVYRYHIVPTYDFEQEILSRGSEVEVLSPKWFRDTIAGDIRAMMKRYD